MDVVSTIKERRSIRKYKSTAVPLDLIYQILDAAHWAPSAGNVQPWRFIVVRDGKTKDKIAQACHNQSWIGDAPVVIVVAVDPTEMFNAYGLRGTKLYSVQECGAAVAYMQLAAQQFGFGSCWVSAFEENLLMDTLGLPEQVRPQAVVTLGYPAEKVPAPRRRNLRDLLFFEKWGTKEIETSAFPVKKHVDNAAKSKIVSKIQKQKDALIKKIKQRFR